MTNGDYTVYRDIIVKTLDEILREEKENIEAAIQLITKVFANENILHVFGSGHSMLIAEELFLRAGQPIYISAILDKNLSVISGAISSAKEKERGYIEKALRNYSFAEGDAALVISVSGVNAAPVEAAVYFKNKGLPVIAITSVEASSKLEPKNKYGKRLHEVADIVIDNKVPYGDAVVEVEGFPYNVIPISTVAGVFIVNTLMLGAIQKMVEMGLKPAVWASGNIPESDKINEQYIGKILGKIPGLGVDKLLMEMSKGETGEVERKAVAKTGVYVVKGNVVTPYHIIYDGVVVVKGEKISYVGPKDDRFIPTNAEIIDVKEGYIFPGFIDVHIHGCEMGNAFDANEASLIKMCNSLAKHGVTGFLPTAVAMPEEQIIAAMNTINKVKEKNLDCSKILGINVEGPFVNPEKKGALIVGFLREASLEMAKELYDKSGGNLKMMTVAPELPNAFDVINWLSERGVIISMGHSNATYEEAIMGINAGARSSTHLFNAMRSIHHRDPGIIIAVLERDDVYAEVIGDGMHVHEPVLKTILKAKGEDKMIIVSDATPLAGMPDGEYTFPGYPKITIENGKATLPDGTMAGSTLTLDKAVRVLHSYGFKLPTLAKLMSKNPATLLGINNIKGDLKPGYHADLTVMDESFNVLYTFVEGKIVYKRQ
ncbi:MAG: N-acetylglucosamine-6-phosphate deacetylase [Candidatus Njordarchaeia archaeon]